MTTFAEFLESRIEHRGECWIWTGKSRSGRGQRHGVIYFRGCTRSAHRFAYIELVGPIPEGKVLDHLCREPLCVNPAHLEAVTQAENVRRGMHGILRTHCKYGHEYTTENTRMYLGKHRTCRTCQRKWQKEAYYRRKEHTVEQH